MNDATLSATTSPANILPTSFLGPLIRYAREHSLDTTLQGALAQAAEQNVINSDEFSRLLQTIQTVPPTPALGIRIGLLATPKDFGLVGYLLASCNTLEQALLRYGRYQTLVLTNLHSQVYKTRSTIRFCWQLSFSKIAEEIEFSAATFVTLYQALIDKPIRPLRVGLPLAKPDQPHIYDALFACPVEFNADSLFVELPANLMLMKVSTRDPFLRSVFDRQAAALLQKNAKNEEGFAVFLEKLRNHLAAAMKDGDVRASTTARTLGYPLRTFYRQLSDNGYSYRTILANVRLHLARHYLVDTALSLAEIALLLGYSEQSAFIRAYKVWVGITPGEYRIAHARRG